MASPEPLTSGPLVQIAASLHRRRLSPVELVDAYTRRIEAAADLHAFITPPGERARREAQRAERRLYRGALGSDTGGSIRVPASLCGCVGLKPTFGALPLDGTFPLGWSLDHAGPLARTVDDAGVLLDVLAGGDAGRKSRRASTRGLRVGLLRGTIVEKVQPAVSRQVAAAAAALRRRGLRGREVAIPEMEWTVATQLVTLRAEASAVYARWIRTRPRAYGADVRIRLQLGSLVAGADYVLAQRMRARIRAAMSDVFHDIDVLLLPSTPIAAPAVGERTVRWPFEG